MIFISHNLQDIFAVADLIVVLRRGVTAGVRRISETDHDEVVKPMVGVSCNAAATKFRRPHISQYQGLNPFARVRCVGTRGDVGRGLPAVRTPTGTV